MSLIEQNKYAASDSPDMRNIEARVWLRVMAMHTEVFNRLNRVFGKEFGITLAKFDVLAQLDRFEGGLTQGALSRHLKVTGGNVTGLVRRLAADGLISREMSVTDRRVFIVRITSDGAAIFRNARKRHDIVLRELFTDMPENDMRAVYECLSKMLVHLRGPATEAPA